MRMVDGSHVAASTSIAGTSLLDQRVVAASSELRHPL